MDMASLSNNESRTLKQANDELRVCAPTVINEQTLCPRDQPVRIKENSNLTLGIDVDKENDMFGATPDCLGPITFSDELTIKHGFLHVGDQGDANRNLRKFSSAPDTLQVAMHFARIYADGYNANATISDAEAALAAATKQQGIPQAMQPLAFESVTEDHIMKQKLQNAKLYSGDDQRPKGRRPQSRRKNHRGRYTGANAAKRANDFPKSILPTVEEVDPRLSSNEDKDARPWERDRPMGNKFLCTFLVGVQEDPEFGVSRRIIGRGGENMRFISDLCRQSCMNDASLKGDAANVKIRLRGRGSGFKERDTKQEANVPLQVNVSTSSRDAYETAKREISYLLSSIYADYVRLYAIEFHVKLFEHPQNPTHW